MFEPSVRDDVCQCYREDARWLVTGCDGGVQDADAIYTVTVPEGFDRTDLAEFREERLSAVGFEQAGPALLTGVSMTHARCASDGPVTAMATVGLSNPATLGLDAEGPADSGHDGRDEDGAVWRPGTVNVLVGTDRSLTDGTLAELLATCVEAKATTLLDLAGFPGTTSDAIAVGCVLEGEVAEFAGSATPVGSSARACVRDAIRASFASRYAESSPPESVESARYGVTTDRVTDVWRP